MSTRLLEMAAEVAQLRTEIAAVRSLIVEPDGGDVTSFSPVPVGPAPATPVRPVPVSAVADDAQPNQWVPKDVPQPWLVRTPA